MTSYRVTIYPARSRHDRPGWRAPDTSRPGEEGEEKEVELDEGEEKVDEGEEELDE